MAVPPISSQNPNIDQVTIQQYASYHKLRIFSTFKIAECFRSIPKQLAKENKKFQYSVVKKGATAAKYAGSLQWIEDAGIISRCYNLTLPELPLNGNAIEDVFKVYMKDTGLLISMLNDYLDQSIEEMEQIIEQLPPDRPRSWESLNSIFLNAVMH